MALKVWGAGSLQGLDGFWDTPSNWDNNTVPVDGDSLLFDETALYPLTNGPGLASVIIENIQVTLGAIVPNPVGTYPLVVVGQLNSASAFPVYIRIYPYGITSIIGKWVGYVVYPSDKPINPGQGYLGISSVLFDVSNYLELAGASLSELKYGTSDILLNVTGASPFTSFKIDFGTVFSLNAVGKISSQLIEFYNTSISIQGDMYLPSLILDSPLINIAQNGSLRQSGLFDLGMITFPQACTLNISTSGSMTYPSPVNEGVVFDFFQSSTINLHGQATIYGTSSSTGMMGAQPSDVSIIGMNGVTINAYDTSLVGGLYSNYGFTNGQLGMTYYSHTIFMRDSSVFQGVITGGMGLGITFLDSSNVSFNYQYDGATNIFQAFPSSVTIGEGIIPQSATGLTIFKSSF